MSAFFECYRMLTKHMRSGRWSRPYPACLPGSNCPQNPPPIVPCTRRDALRGIRVRGGRDDVNFWTPRDRWCLPRTEFARRQSDAQFPAPKRGVECALFSGGQPLGWLVRTQSLYRCCQLLYVPGAVDDGHEGHLDSGWYCISQSPCTCPSLARPRTMSAQLQLCDCVAQIASASSIAPIEA